MQTLEYEFIAHPRILYGDCSLEEIPAELAENDACKPLVIASREAVRRKLGKTLIRAFYDSGCIIGGIYDEVRDYAGISLALNAAQLFRKRGCDAFIALGDRAAADIARAANILVSHKTDTLLPFFNGETPSRRLMPFIFVPTCCTGASAAGRTLFIDNRRLHSDYYFPDVVVTDRRMSLPCSARCAAESAILAMDNALWSIIDDNQSPMKNAFAHAALKLIGDNLSGFLKRPRDGKRALPIANAGVLASIAAANARPGIVRVLGEELEKETSIPAAVFIANLTPAALFCIQKNESPLPGDLLLAAAGMDAYAAVPTEQLGRRGAEAIIEMFESAANEIPEAAISRIPAHLLAEACNNAASREMVNFGADDAMAVLEMARQEMPWQTHDNGERK